MLTLLLEDEPLIALGVETTLKGAGFNVSTVMSCTDAHAWLDQRRPSLVVVDIELRDGPSTDVVSRLIDTNIPFIVHSGDHWTLHAGTPFAHGSWVTKPGEPRELIQAALAAIGR